MEQAEQDPDLIALSRQFKATAMELISVLEQVNISCRTLSLLFTSIRFQVWPPDFTEQFTNYIHSCFHRDHDLEQPIH